MKICGYCGNAYDDKQENCPKCGASLLKKTSGAESVLAEHERIKKEIAQSKKKGNKTRFIGVAGIVLVVVIVAVSVVAFMNGSQRKIAEESKELVSQAQQLIDTGDYIGAIQYIDQMDSSVKSNADIQAAYNSAITGYKAQIFSTVESHIETGDYISAKSVLTVLTKPQKYISQRVTHQR